MLKISLHVRKIGLLYNKQLFHFLILMFCSLYFLHFFQFFSFSLVFSTFQHQFLDFQALPVLHPTWTYNVRTQYTTFRTVYMNNTTVFFTHRVAPDLFSRYKICNNFFTFLIPSLDGIYRFYNLTYFQMI